MSAKESNLTCNQQKLVNGVSSNKPVVDTFQLSSSTTFMNVSNPSVVTTTLQVGKHSKPLIISPKE